eukprot:11188088-Alexandrium_andersonii.AAC.1
MPSYMFRSKCVDKHVALEWDEYCKSLSWDFAVSAKEKSDFAKDHSHCMCLCILKYIVTCPIDTLHAVRTKVCNRSNAMPWLVCSLPGRPRC